MKVTPLLQLAGLIAGILLMSRLKTQWKYAGLLLIMFASLPLFTTDYVETFATDSNDSVLYDSWIEIQNVSATNSNNSNNFLLLDWMNGWARGTSGQRQVSLAWNRNYRTMWRVKGTLESGPNLNKGSPVKSGDIIRLESVFDNLNLHSHPLRADYDDKFNCNEVTGFGYREGDDSNSLWQIDIKGGGNWIKSSLFSLRHVNTGKYLTAPAGVNHKVFPDPNNNWSLGLVAGAPSLVADSYWTVYRTEKPGARAVRFYKDVEMDESNMIDYQLTGSLKDIEVDTVRDGRAGHEFIKGLIIPEGYSVDLYRGPNKTTLFATFNSGRWDNLNLGTSSTVVIHRYCAISVYDQCDFQGNSRCLPYGISEMPTDVNSWRLSDGAQATMLSSTSDWQLGNNDKAVTCKTTSSNSNFGVITEVVTYPDTTKKILYRANSDPVSLTSLSVSALTDKLPTVATDSLMTYLNSAISGSYPGTGRTWYDVSGNNRHFVWDSTPRFVKGMFMTTDLNGQTARGPPGNSFGLADGGSGYTFCIVCQTYSPSDNWGLSMTSKNGDPHGLSCHLPESNSWSLSMCFDQGWGAPSNRNTRLLVAQNNPPFSKYGMNVIICRRNGNSTDAKQSIWINGVKIAENANRANELDLSVSNAMIFVNYKGACQAFALWRTPLGDDDIAKVTAHFKSVNESYRDAAIKSIMPSMSQNIPNVRVTRGLTCLLDSRDSRSAGFGNRLWKDLSGYGNHFTWNSPPKLANGRWVSTKLNGGGLLGPPSDSFGIEQNGGGYTIFVAAKTNRLTANQAFRFRGDVPYQRGIFAHATWTDGNMYFDQSGCCDQNTQRVQTAVPWQTFNVYAVRRTHSPSMRSLQQARNDDNIPANDLNKLSIFINGSKTVEGSSSANVTRLNGQPVEIGGSSTENYDWDADIGAFAVYNRALSNSEIKIMSDYLQAPKYGSTQNISGATDNSTGVQAGVCVPQTLDGTAYDPTMCLSKSKNTSGNYDYVPADGRGWCFTDAQDSTKWGWCTDKRDIDIDKTYDKSNALSYAAAAETCANRGGRLCNVDEICDAGAGKRPKVGYESLNKADCNAAGGTYNDVGQFCGTQASGGSAPFLIPAGQAYVPVNDADNTWVNISGDDYKSMCKTYESINGNKPAWGLTSEDNPSKRNLVCCDVGELTPCEILANNLKVINDKLEITTDPTLKTALQNQKQDIINQQMKTCMTETYIKAVTDLSDAERIYSDLMNRVNIEKSDNAVLRKQLFDLSSVVDKNGKQFFDSDHAKANKGVPYDDGSFKPTGQIPTLQQALKDTQTAIAQQIARYNACPGQPTCDPPTKKSLIPPGQTSTKCDPDALKSALLSNPSLTPEKLQLLTTLLSPQNILKSTDIRQHKDFYKLVKAQNVQPCNSLGTGPVNQPDISSFNIEDHPDFKAKRFIPLISVPISRVPQDRLSDAQRLLGGVS